MEKPEEEDEVKEDFEYGKSVFNERIIGRKQFVFLIEEEGGEKFGYYLNSEVIEKEIKQLRWRIVSWKPTTSKSSGLKKRRDQQTTCDVHSL